MTYSTRMITRSSMKAEYVKLQDLAPILEPDVKAKLAVRLAFLNSHQKTDLNLAAHYSLSGETEVVFAVMDLTHPMRDVFTNRGEPRDVRVVEYIRNHLAQQSIEQDILRLEALSI